MVLHSDPTSANAKRAGQAECAMSLYALMAAEMETVKMHLLVSASQAGSALQRRLLAIPEGALRLTPCALLAKKLNRSLA